MADKELEDIIKRNIPQARIIKSQPIEGADAASAYARAEGDAPETHRLLEKYFGKKSKKPLADESLGIENTRAVGDSSPSDESISIAEIELPDDGTDTGNRLAKRTVLVDRKRKTILGSSG